MLITKYSLLKNWSEAKIFGLPVVARSSHSEQARRLVEMTSPVINIIFIRFGGGYKGKISFSPTECYNETEFNILKMRKIFNNYAFIDSQNLHMAIQEQGWKIDYKRLRIYLKEHYHVKKAYMFMGFKPSEQQMYNFLQEAGYILIFKPILELKNGEVKGNCDAELVLQAMIDYKHYDRAIIVSGDGDFHCLIKYLQEKKKLQTVLVPTDKNCSILIKKIIGGNLTLVSALKKKLQYQEKTQRQKTNKKKASSRRRT